jgi:hypothetical protein
MKSWLRNFRARREERTRAAEEKEFFEAWDEMGWPDYDSEGNPIHPAWDEDAGEWVYGHRPEGRSRKPS